MDTDVVFTDLSWKCEATSPELSHSLCEPHPEEHWGRYRGRSFAWSV